MLIFLLFWFFASLKLNLTALFYTPIPGKVQTLFPENLKINFLLKKVWNLPCEIKIKHWKKSCGKVRVIRFTTGKKCCAFSSRWFDTQGRDPRTNQFIMISSGEPCFKDRNIQLLDLTNYFLFFHHLQARSTEFVPKITSGTWMNLIKGRKAAKIRRNLIYKNSKYCSFENGS